MFSIADRLKGAKSSETLGELLTEAMSAHRDAMARQAEFESRRDTVFLEGTADEIAALEDGLAAVNREIMRLEVQTAGLRDRVAAAEAREAAENFEVVRAAALRVHHAGVAIYTKSYVKYAEKIAADMAALQLVDQHGQDFNRYASSVGQGDKVIPPVSAVVGGGGQNQDVSESVALPQADRAAQRFWPPGAPTAESIAKARYKAERRLKKEGVTLEPLPLLESVPADPPRLAVAS